MNAAFRRLICACLIPIPAFAQGETRTATPRPATAANVSVEQFRSIRWLVGRWRGIGYGRLAAVGTFFEEYGVLDDSTIRMRTFSDSTFRSATDSTMFELRGGTLTARPARGTAQSVIRFVKDSVQWGGTGTQYVRVSDDHWRAEFPMRAGETERRVYELRRADLPSGNCGRQFGDPAESPYLLPFPVGRTYTMFQGNCPPDLRWGHRGWLAYDFDMAIGDTVIASRAGTVRWVVQNWPDSDRRCGQENGVWITHDDSTVMAYVHFTTNGARVKVGDRVAAGDLIGLSGDSGCSSAPHLHVNLMRDGSSRQKWNLVPFNYRNAIGPHDVLRALVQDARYTARR